MFLSRALFFIVIIIQVTASWPWDDQPFMNNPKCGQHFPFSRERYKNQAGPGEVPMLVSINSSYTNNNYKENLKAYCMGAIWNHDELITVRQCVDIGYETSNPKDFSWFILAGSNYRNQTRSQSYLAHRSISIDANKLSCSNQCGDPPSMEGLAIIKLKDELEFKINKKDPYNLNRICVDRQAKKISQYDDDLYMTYWDDNECAKLIKMKRVSCKIDFKNTNKSCFKSSVKLTKPIPDGTPLMRRSGEKGDQWTLVGLYSSGENIWIQDRYKGKFEEKEYFTFILINDDKIIDWIWLQNLV